MSELYLTIAIASTGVVNLGATLNPLKGIEHLLTNIHGEHEVLSRVLKNGSGTARCKVSNVSENTLSSQDKQKLTALIYHPGKKMAQILNQVHNREDWYKVALYRLIEVSKRAVNKYTRSGVRKTLPPEFAYVIEELITEKVDVRGKKSCYSAIVRTIIRMGRAGEFTVALCELTQCLIVDHLYIPGDTYGRGPGPHIIMDKLISYHSLDIQWGDHDMLWIGAAVEQRGCIANAIRICARYGNLDTLEDGHGVNLLPLVTFALDVYGGDPYTCSVLKGTNTCSPSETDLSMRMHKATSIIQFRVEGQLIKEHPKLKLEARDLLHLVDFEKGTTCLGEKEYQMTDCYSLTMDPMGPYRLIGEEEGIMERLVKAFMDCEKLRQHMYFLPAKGSLYKVYNGNLFYHGYIPLSEDGSSKEVEIYKETCKGKALYKWSDSYVRKGFMSTDREEQKKGRDICQCIWLYQSSPLFGEGKMATLKRCSLTDEETHREGKDPYHNLLKDKTIARAILDKFGLFQEEGRTVNGHVPMKSRNDENPIKCGRKVLVIGGRFLRTHQKGTDTAGYAFSHNSYGLILTAHEPFEFTKAAIEKESDIHLESVIVERAFNRKLMSDTDVGCQLETRIRDLEALLEVYHTGKIVERSPVRQGT